MNDSIKNELIDLCIEENFKKNCISHLKRKLDWKSNPNEIHLEIIGGRIGIAHQNETQDKNRLSFVLKLLQATIEIKKLDLNCRVTFNMTDGVEPQQYYTRICFSAPTYSNHLFMPDPHLFYHIKTITQNVRTDCQFEEKEDLISFVGSDSGLIEEDLLNQRIRFCAKAAGNKFVSAKISNFVHFTDEMLSDLNIDKQILSREGISINDQLPAKYILDIDGNGSSWDRILWAMYSNCYFIHLKSENNKNVNWYRPYIEKYNLMPTYTEEQILSGQVSYDKDIKLKQQQFARTLLDQDTQLEYFARTLIKYNEIYNN